MPEFELHPLFTFLQLDSAERRGLRALMKSVADDVQSIKQIRPGRDSDITIVRMLGPGVRFVDSYLSTRGHTLRPRSPAIWAFGHVGIHTDDVYEPGWLNLVIPIYMRGLLSFTSLNRPGHYEQFVFTAHDSPVVLFDDSEPHAYASSAGWRYNLALIMGVDATWWESLNNE